MPQPSAPRPPDAADALIGVAEAAKMLGVNPSTLIAWLKQGRIPSAQYVLGGLYRIRRGDVLAFIEASCLRKTPDDA